MTRRPIGVTAPYRAKKPDDELEKAFQTLEELSARWPQIMDAVVALRKAFEQKLKEKK